MKTIRVIILLTVLTSAMSIKVFSQNEYIKEDVIDDMLDYRRIQTFWLSATSPMKTNKQIYYIKYFSASNLLRLELKVNSLKGYGFIEKGGLLVIKLENDSIIKLHSEKSAVVGEGKGAIGLMGSGLKGVHVNYTITIKDLKAFAKFKFKKFRVYMSDHYFEDEMHKEVYLSDLQKSAAAMVEQLGKKCENIKRK